MQVQVSDGGGGHVVVPAPWSPFASPKERVEIVRLLNDNFFSRVIFFFIDRGFYVDIKMKDRYSCHHTRVNAAFMHGSLLNSNARADATLST